MDKEHCATCKFGVRKWVLGGIPVRRIDSSKISCKRFPTETTHKPHDWCGEWKDCNDQSRNHISKRTKLNPRQRH